MRSFVAVTRLLPVLLACSTVPTLCAHPTRGYKQPAKDLQDVRHAREYPGMDRVAAPVEAGASALGQ